MRSSRLSSLALTACMPFTSLSAPGSQLDRPPSQHRLSRCRQRRQLKYEPAEWGTSSLQLLIVKLSPLPRMPGRTSRGRRPWDEASGRCGGVKGYYTCRRDHGVAALVRNVPNASRLVPRAYTLASERLKVTSPEFSICDGDELEPRGPLRSNESASSRHRLQDRHHGVTFTIGLFCYSAQQFSPFRLCCCRSR